MIRIFRHYIPGSYLLLGLVETIVLIASIYGGVFIRLEGDVVGAAETFSLFPTALTFALVMITTMTAMGLYARHLREGLRGMVWRIAGAFGLGFLAMSIIFYLFPDLSLWRGAFGLSWLLGLAGVVLTRYLFLKLVDQAALKRRILVLGSGHKAALINRLLRRRADRRGFEIVIYVHFDGEPEGVKSCLTPHDRSLLAMVEQYEVDEIIVALDDRRNRFPMEEIVDCRMAGVEVIDLMTFFERQTCKLPLDLLQPSWLAYSDGFRFSAFRIYTKRLFDIGISLLILCLTWPLMLLTVLAILFDSRGRGGVLYRQERVGQNGKPFSLLKFRSMQTDAEKDGIAQWAQKNDSRITRVGRLIRRTRIDELPQVFNVLNGDMSFVGPRPERPVFVEKLGQNIPYFFQRHRVKPGITGWAQICYPYGASDKDAGEKLQYDLYYVKNYSLFLDLMILFQTAQVVIWGKGAR